MKWSKIKETGRREECSVIIGFTDFFDKFKNLQKMKKVFAKKRSFLQYRFKIKEQVPKKQA